MGIASRSNYYGALDDGHISFQLLASRCLVESTKKLHGRKLDVFIVSRPLVHCTILKKSYDNPFLVNWMLSSQKRQAWEIQDESVSRIKSNESRNEIVISSMRNPSPCTQAMIYSEYSGEYPQKVILDIPF